MIRGFMVFMVLFASLLGVAELDVTGTWRVNGSFDAASIAKGGEQPIDLECTFEQHGDGLRGTCGPSTGPDGVPIAGSVHDRAVEWHFDIALNATAKKQTVTFTGTVPDGASAMRGTFAIADLRGEFAAERQ